MAASGWVGPGPPVPLTSHTDGVGGLRPQPCGSKGWLAARLHPDPHIRTAGELALRGPPVCVWTPCWRHTLVQPSSCRREPGPQTMLTHPCSPGLHPLPRASCLRSPSWTRARAEQNREKQPLGDPERQTQTVDTVLTVERPKED